MASLFGISKDVLNAVLTNWCSVDQLQAVDIAFCNHDSRCEWLAFLTNDTLRLNDKVGRPLLKWLSLRKIKFRGLVLSKREFGGTDKLCFDLDTFAVWQIDVADNDSGSDFARKYVYKKRGRVWNAQLETVANVTQTALISIIIACPKLNSLKVSHLETFTDNTLELIPQIVLNQITTVNFSNLPVGFTGTGLIKFAKNLTVLILGHNLGIAPNDVIDLIKATEGKLEFITITLGCTDRLIETVAECCPKLQRFSTFENSKGLTNITSIAKMLQKCSNLTSADFIGEDYNHIQFITKTITKSTASMDRSACSKSTTRGLKFHGTFSDKSTPHVAEFFNIITRINFTAISMQLASVNDAVLSAIATHNPSLRVFDYEQCVTTFTGHALQQLGKACPNLHTLSLVPVTQLSDSDFKLLFTSNNDGNDTNGDGDGDGECAFKNLRHLRISENSDILEQTVCDILSRHVQLASSAAVNDVKPLETLYCHGLTKLNNSVNLKLLALMVDGAEDGTIITTDYSNTLEPYSTLEQMYIQ